MGHNDLQFNLLQSELVVNQFKESERAFARHVFTTQFNPSFLPTQLRMRSNHLAIQNERNVSVKFLLELMQTLVRVVPRPRFVHHEEDFTGSLIECKEVYDTRIGDPAR